MIFFCLQSFLSIKQQDRNMSNRFTINIAHDIIHTLEDRLNYLNSLKQKLEKMKKTRDQIKYDLKWAIYDVEKKLLQKKLKKYNRTIMDMEYSIKLAQRDYDDKVRRIEESREYVNYMLNRCR